MTSVSNLVRSEGDPKIIRSGRGSVAPSDRIGKALGWFSLGLGLVELLAAGRITRTLGMEGHEALVRAYGVREIGSGILSLSTEKQIGLWSRVGGDGLDIATLVSGLRDDNPKRDNVMVALMMVAGIAVLDILAAQGTTIRHRRNGEPRLYSDRSGFPKGVQAARGLASRAKQAA